MSLLEEFEEKKEIVLEEHVKTLIDEAFSEYSQEVKSLHEIAKTKTAEMVLELKKIQELENKTEEYHQKSEDTLNKMLENSEKFTKTFEEKLEEIKNTNEIFETSLRESRFFEKLEGTVYNSHQKYLQSSEEALREIETKANQSMLAMEKHLKFRDNILKGSVFIFVVVLLSLVFSYYNVRKDMISYKREVSVIKKIMEGDKKYWYDEKNRELIFRDPKEHRERKEEIKNQF